MVFDARKTQKLQVRVSEENASWLADQSHAHSVPVTEFGGALLERAIEAERRGDTEALVMPLIRRLIRQELGRFQSEVLEMMIRTYMEAGTTRRIMLTDIARTSGLPREEVKRLEEANWNVTYEALRKQMKGMPELLAHLRSEDDLRNPGED